jgi:hypothetical protein
MIAGGTRFHAIAWACGLAVAAVLAAPGFYVMFGIADERGTPPWFSEHLGAVVGLVVSCILAGVCLSYGIGLLVRGPVNTRSS